MGCKYIKEDSKSGPNMSPTIRYTAKIHLK